MKTFIQSIALVSLLAAPAGCGEGTALIAEADDNPGIEGAQELDARMAGSSVAEARLSVFDDQTTFFLKAHSDRSATGAAGWVNGTADDTREKVAPENAAAVSGPTGVVHLVYSRTLGGYNEVIHEALGGATTVVERVPFAGCVPGNGMFSAPSVAIGHVLETRFSVGPLGRIEAAWTTFKNSPVQLDGREQRLAVLMQVSSTKLRNNAREGFAIRNGRQVSPTGFVKGQRLLARAD